ncbi:MAG: NAD(P)H-binding protein [Geodermatophilaceae bacterium]
MRRTILITAATGRVSSALVDALDGTDHRLRALVRHPAKAPGLGARGAEVHAGDLGDPHSLAPAFEGVSDLWLLTPNGPHAPEHSMNALWAARRAGVPVQPSRCGGSSTRWRR